jgi:hypothetical protein
MPNRFGVCGIESERFFPTDFFVFFAQFDTLTLK